MTISAGTVLEYDNTREGVLRLIIKGRLDSEGVGSLWTQCLAILVPALIQFTVGNFIQPKLMGRSLNLHPVSILLSLILFGAIRGIIGVFPATPMTGVLKILFEKFKYTAPAANLHSAKCNGGNKF